MSKCPGQDNRNITSDYYKCKCSQLVEIFSNESKVRCFRCGEYVTRKQRLFCFDWCPSARECMGEDRWKIFKEGKDDV